MGIKLKFDSSQSDPRKFSQGVGRFSERKILAVQATAKRIAEEIEYAGRNDIRAGGNFGSARWQEGFRAKISYKSRIDLQIRVTHEVSYWRVFEFGARILGKPLLWIPLSFGNAFGKRARDYGKPLFRVNRKNGKAPLLLDDQGPQYVGLESVKIPKKWHLRRETSKVFRRIKSYFKEAMKNGR